MSLHPYEVIVVPQDPMKGVWMRRKCWDDIDTESMRYAIDDAVFCLHQCGHPEMIVRNQDGDDSVLFRLADEEQWPKLMTLHLATQAMFIHYFPPEDEIEL